jgi:hypothetical protein
MSDVKDIEMGEDAVTNPSTDDDAPEEEESDKGLIRVVCFRPPPLPSPHQTKPVF